MTELITTRRETLREIRAQMEEIFAATDYQSLLFAVAQYWNDGADDELHTKLFGSRRSLPLWPHRCADDVADDQYDEEGNPLPDATLDPDEGCSWCTKAIEYMDIGSTQITRAFETYCHEYGNQESSVGFNYLPYAVGRRRTSELGNLVVDIEIIGVPQRPALEIVAPPASPSRRTSWIDDPRARSLYELVCANPGDDGARRVLGDYLLEHAHPHGELIALSLAGELDPDVAAHRDRLLEQHGRHWLGPLAGVIPAEAMHFERGFLARAYVYATEHAERAARGHAAWGTVERIDLAPGSTSVLHPSMVALREIGLVVDDHDCLFGAHRPWAIEKLRIRIDDPEMLTALATTKLLPKLREVVVQGAQRFAAVDRLAVERVIVGEPGTWLPTKQQLASGRTIGIAEALSDGRDRAGWELAFTGDRVAAKMVGWHESATLRGLADRVRALPHDLAVELVPSVYYVPAAGDVERVRDRPERRIAIRG